MQVRRLVEAAARRPLGAQIAAVDAAPEGQHKGGQKQSGGEANGFEGAEHHLSKELSRHATQKQ